MNHSAICTHLQHLQSLARGTGLRARLIRGAMGVGAVKILSLSLTFASSIVLARALGPERFGQYTFIMSVIMVLSMLLDQGMRQLITREVASYKHGEHWELLRGIFRRTQQWYFMGLLLVVIILGSVAISKTTWSMDDYWTLLLIGLIILPFFGLSGLLGATLRGLNYVVQAQLPEMLAMPAFHLILIVFLLSHGFLNQATALLSKAAAAAIALAIAAFLLHRHWPGQVRVSNAEYRNAQWACAWLPFTLLMAANLLNSEIGILLLGWLGTDEQVAALRLAYRGAQLVVISLSIVNLVIAPHVTQTHRSGNTTQLQQLSRQSARAALAGALPVAIPLIFWGAPIISFVFGAEYVNMTLTPLAILASAQLINVGFGSVGIFLTMSGFEKDTLCVQCISLLVNIVSGILLIPKFGATGAACSGAMGLITWNILLGILFIQRLKIRPSAI